MVRAVALFTDGQRSAKKGLSFCPPVAHIKQVSQVSERIGDIRMVKSQGLFLDGQHSAKKGLSFWPPVGLMEQAGQVIE